LTSSPWDTPSPWGSEEPTQATSDAWAASKSETNQKRWESRGGSRGWKPSSFGAILWLWLAALFVVLSAYLWRIETITAHIFGYGFAGLGTTTSVALFRLADVNERAQRNYEHRPWASPFAIALTIAAFALVVTHVWPLATEWAKP